MQFCWKDEVIVLVTDTWYTHTPNG